MCDPFTLMLGGSAALQAGGSLFGGAASSKAHKMSAQLADANAGLLETQAQIAKVGADIAVTRGNYDEFLQRRKVEHVLAAETTHFAGGNVDPTYGSPLMIQGFSAAQGETSAQLIRARMMAERADALTGAANIEGQAVGQRFKANAERAAATTSMVSGVLGAGTAFLSAGSKWASLGAGGGGGSDFAAGLRLGVNPFLLSQPSDL